MKEKFLPKVTIPTPLPGICPTGARTMAGLFKWPEVFLALLSHAYGAGRVTKRIQSWGWDVATSFSGVGCPENASRRRKNLFTL